MRNLILLLFLLTIINPYDSIECYECSTLYIIDSEPEYGIKVYGPSADENQTEFTQEETDRFIQKAVRIISYPPYVF